MDVSCCGSCKVNAGVSFQSNPTCAGGLYASMVCTLCADTIAAVLAMVLPRVWLVLSCFSLSLFFSFFLTFSSTLFPPIGIGSLDTTTALKRVQSTTAVTTRSKTTTAMASITGRRRWYVISSSPSLAPSVMSPYSIYIYVCVC